MNSSGMILLLLLLVSAATSSPHIQKEAYNLLRSQFLSTEDVKSTIERLENGQNEEAELVTMEEKRSDGMHRLNLKTKNRNLELHLEPSYRLISPNARLVVVDKGVERVSELDPTVRSSLFHGSVSGSSAGSASLVRNNHGWNGIIMTDKQRFLLHGVQGSSRSILLPMADEGNTLVHGSEWYDRTDYNMSGDESFSRSVEYNMSGDESFTRSTKSEFQLELGVYTDEDLYKYAQKKYPNEADIKKKVQEIVLITLNTVHTFYQKPSIGNKIAIVVTQLTIMTSNPSGLSKNLKMNTYLTNFCNWDSASKNPGGANYDFGLLFSGLDMYGEKPSDTGTAGLSPVSRVCLHNTKRSCAIGEARGFGSGIIMAHEIGHNLGMMHDSEGNNCARKGYIMGAIISSGATTFSTCSKDYLSKYLKSLDEFGLNCMRNEGKAQVAHEVQDQLPGERLKPGEQCSYALGQGYREATEEPTFCSQLQCTSPTGGISTPNGGPPLPGTPCGTTRADTVCWNGKCTSKSTVMAEIKAYTATNSGFAGKTLSINELCEKYGINKGERYPIGLSYDFSKTQNIAYGDISNMCSNGMLCQRNSPLGLLRIQYVAPPGTSCAEGKVCKNFACVEKGTASNTGTGGTTGGESGSGGTTGGGQSGTGSTTGGGQSGTGSTTGSGQSGTGSTTGGGQSGTGSTTGSGQSGTGGNTGGGKSGAGGNQGPTAPPAGYNTMSSTYYCRKTISRYSKGLTTYDCRQAHCQFGYRVTTTNVFNWNICPSGQICDAGICANKATAPAPQGAMASSQKRYVDYMCRRYAGWRFKSLCTTDNLHMYPEYAQYCTRDVCAETYCVGRTRFGQWQIKGFVPRSWSRCDRGKRCRYYQCQ